MPSYLRLLTEQPAHIGTPPTGHTALYASSGTGGEHKYELYIKNPEGFSHPVGVLFLGMQPLIQVLQYTQVDIQCQVEVLL